MAYLQTALSEMRDRTWIGESRHAATTGADMIGRMWDRAVSDSLLLRRAENLQFTMREIELATAGRADADDLIDEMLSLGTVIRRPTAHRRPEHRRARLALDRRATRTIRASRGTMKFGIFYEHQLPAPVGRRQRAAADPGRARPGRARRPARHPLRVGGRAPLPRGVLALLRARGVPRRVQPAHDEHPPRPRHHPDGRRATTTRPAPPSASPRSTWCRTAGSSSARASRRRRPSSAASASTRPSSARPWLEGLEVAMRCMTEDAVHRRRRPVRADAAAQRRAQAACRSRTRRSGWRAAGATPSCWPPRRASAR